MGCNCKKGRFCVCSHIALQRNQHFVLLLQHPQEPKEILSTAVLVHKTLENSSLKVGLSWPNIAAILDKPFEIKSFATLFLKNRLFHHSKTVILDAKEKIVHKDEIKGLIVLDGTWSQAKTLWWRNPWLLKTRRLVLETQTKSLYGSLRREPHPQCLSTIESVAAALDYLEEPSQISESLRNTFKQLIKNFSGSVGT
jgi:DTW domain-containing protein YfiP